MGFALSTAQLIAVIVVGAATAVVTNWVDWLVRKRKAVEQKITVRLLGSAVAAEPGDVIVLAVSKEMSGEDIDRIAEDFRPLTERGIKIAFMDSATGVAVARARKEETGG